MCLFCGKITWRQRYNFNFNSSTLLSSNAVHFAATKLSATRHQLTLQPLELQIILQPRMDWTGIMLHAPLSVVGPGKGQETRAVIKLCVQGIGMWVHKTQNTTQIQYKCHEYISVSVTESVCMCVCVCVPLILRHFAAEDLCRNYRKCKLITGFNWLQTNNANSSKR